MASSDGTIDLMFSVWHFRIMPVRYLEMCSERVNTLPCAIGALGPRIAN